MKTLTLAILFIVFTFSFLKAEEVNSPEVNEVNSPEVNEVNSLEVNEVNSKKTIFSKKDILKLTDAYVNNNVGVKNPVIVDINNDGIFDILNFTSKGNIEYYKNTGSLESPSFILENKKFDDFEINSYLPRVEIPVFFADKDGDKDVDVFGIVKDGYNSKTLEQQYKVVYVENTMFLDNYVLITVVLILLIIVLLIVIVR